MSTEIDPSMRIFKEDSKAERISGSVVVLSIVLFIATLILCGVAIMKAPYWSLVVSALAFFWAVSAPAWFWYEYFFLYRKDGEKGSFDLYKHGQQVSIAIWAGLAVSLGALANSDLFKEKEFSSKAVQGPTANAGSLLSGNGQHQISLDRQSTGQSSAR